jgi:cell division protein FtsQ
MASHLNPPIKYRTEDFLSQPFQFQRGEGKIKIKKVQRKIILQFKHIVLFFSLMAGLFYSFQRFYLFLISWENLKIKEVQILCQRETVKEELQLMIREEKLGNILLLDMDHLQSALERHRWVQEAQIRKVFPSSLKIEIKEREPAALLKKDIYYLIDEQGVELEHTKSIENIPLPVFVDANDFRTDSTEKLKLAWDCLKSLPSNLREQVDTLDLTEYGNLILQFKNSPAKIMVGDNQFSQKIELFLKTQDWLENQFGPLEYVDFRLEDRIYFKAQAQPNPGEEPLLNPQRRSNNAKK